MYLRAWHDGQHEVILRETAIPSPFFVGKGSWHGVDP